MAAASVSVKQEPFSCAICQDQLKDPVTIPCGHSYCVDCINNRWDKDDKTGVYSCPQCRQTFNRRPVLKSTEPDKMAEELKTRLHPPPPAHCYAGPGDVACDVCTGRKRKAVKSCLQCLRSYCDTDLIRHHRLNYRKSHKLINATENLQKKVCSRHKKLFRRYCLYDQQCICSLCQVYKHREHDTVSAAVGRTQKQKELREAQRKFQQRIQEREKELQDLRQTVESLTHSAQAAVEDSERIFTELISSIKKSCSEMKKLIRDQEKAAVQQAKGVIKRVEREVAKLRKREAEQEKLSHAKDDIYFLKSCQSLCVPPGCGDSIDVKLHMPFGFVRTSVSELKQQVRDFCKTEFQCPREVQFQCNITGLVFVMEMVGEVQYSTALWDTSLLTPTGQQPAGPLFNITCPQGSMHELHLPHCEVLSGKRCDFLSVAHVVGDSTEVLQPLEVTDTHVRVKAENLSFFGLLTRLFTSTVQGQVLLFLRQPGGDILNVLLLPRNIPFSEVQQQQQGNLPVQTTPNCTLKRGETYCLSCQQFETQPKNAPFDCEYGPNYHPTFEVFLERLVEEVNLRLFVWNSEIEVWMRRVRLPGATCVIASVGGFEKS
ncbi:E3 ubiquitin-protein ligase TRIM47-like [Megalops cyprinoides]|uniref:E3 ubiquitin-protein ligase TRIM47-like n=1 Tax=Megalops cyprinoides TaxID=118141 RepID=UPI001864965B|nr:E3 ubiquitin-protein ligase TRIM47-like [Megalops cyprinoides]